MRRAAISLGLLFLLVSCQQPSAPPAQNVNPVAVFSMTANGLTVDVNGSNSVDPDGSIVAYSWNFGDGSSSSGATAQRTYAAAGSYTVTLTVTDNRGATGTSQQTATVTGSSTGTGKGTVQGSVSWPTGVQDVGEFRAGELLVRFNHTGLQSLSTNLQVAGFTFSLERPTALQSTGLYVNRALDHQQTLELARALEQRPDVVYAAPNRVFRRFATPNDPLYQYQWHYSAMNLPLAWDITTGAPGGVVAVVDTGILWDDNDPGMSHPDLEGRVLPGYDMISDIGNAGDGDGRDPNPYDVGDNQTAAEAPSFHGTHVAGTIAAATNNGTGVAGVDWQAGIVAVRVLGKLGGDGDDILDGIRWAAGLPVPGTEPNANPARVINLSLGGDGMCDGPWLDTVNAVLATGAILVVAAGNDSQNMAGTSPANCPGVITVGASDHQNNRAPYSNFGSGVDVMAPGGNLGINITIGGESFPAGVLSTKAHVVEGELYLYDTEQGTSMAAPHVAGLVSLMLALDEDLTSGQVRAVLKETAVPMTAAQCATGGPVSDCGAGRVDALAALQMVQSGNLPEPDPDPDPDPQPGTPSGPMQVQSVTENGSGGYDLLGLANFAAPTANYTLESDPGQAWVLAWTDEDGSGTLTVGDYYGEYPNQVTISAGGSLTGIDIPLQVVVPNSASALEASIRE